MGNHAVCTAVLPNENSKSDSWLLQACEGGKINIHMKTVNTVWNIELSIGLDHINLEVLAGYIVFTGVAGNKESVSVCNTTL